MAQALLLLIQVGSTIALLLVATYHLLASIPFSYYHFLQFPHFWWMPAFIKLHPLVALAAVAGLFLSLRDLPASLARWRRAFALAGVTAVGCMTAAVWIPGFDSFEVASVLCFLSIGLIGASAWIDLVARRRAVSSFNEPSRSGEALIRSAALAGAVSAAAYLLRAMLVERSQATGLRVDEIGVAAVASVGGQIALFTTAALGTVTIRAVAARRAWEPWHERLALSAAAAFVLAWVIRRTVLTALILSELRAIVLAAMLGVTAVLTSQAILARWRRAAGRKNGSRWTAVAALAGLMFVCVGVLPDQLRLADWGFTLQKLLVVMTWVASVVLVRSLPDSRRLRLGLAVAIAALLVSRVAGTMTLAQRREPSTTPAAHKADLGLAIDRYATIDTSLMVLLDLVRPVVSDADFFSLLYRVGAATDDGSLHAVPLRLSDDRSARSSPPHLFIIVIDSLRPDYISAYNPEATFTPAIGAFASESLVWRQAFTSYTGTALSQPALWAGGLIQRRMYIRPFSAVDNLERLVTAGGYRRYISMDAILNALLEDRSNLVPLDSHLAHPEKLEEMFKFDLCPTLHELAADLDRDAHRTEPIFFYSQPQNLHVRVLGIKSPRYIETRKGGSRFFKPAVDALTRIDGCFGTFIDYLKAKDLFANSIIILTSDHGDAYGEGGLWGHAFYMVPETVRIPLIMHVPEYLRRERYWDPEAVALLTDVTPTLYALSGYHLHAGDLLGRPLLTRDAAEAQADRRDRYFLQSSYNLNFGLLDGHAGWLYVANATASTETFFDLHDPQAGPRPLTKADRFKYRKWLLDWVERLNAYYLPKAVATH